MTIRAVPQQRSRDPEALVALTSPAVDSPVGSIPRRAAYRAKNGRSWELVVDTAGVTVTTARGATTVAEAHVWDREGELTIEFWVDGADVPTELGAQLVAHAFAHPRVHARQPVLLRLPRRDGSLLQQALRHVVDPRTRAAGRTCLVEGRVGSRPGAVPRPRSA